MPRLSLTKKVLGVFLAILLPILLTIYIVFHKNRIELKDLLIDQLQQITDEREAYIFMYLEMNKSRMLDFSSDDFIVRTIEEAGTDKKRAARILDEYLTRYKLPLLRSMYRLNVIAAMDGRIIASTRPGYEGRDLSNEEYFKNGLQGISVTEVTSGNVPEVVVSAPVYSRRGHGRVIGVIAGFTELSKFGEFFSGEYIKRLGALTWNPPFKRWKTFEIYLVNRDKLMLTESHFIKEAVLRQKVDTPPVRACVEKGTEFTGVYADYRGVEVVGASMCIPSFGWTLVVEVDEREVFEPVIWNERYAVALVLVVTGFMTILVVYFVRRIVGQVTAIAGAAGELAKGNYETRVTARSRDEIGSLAESFNAMASKIMERTDELAESEERLRSILDSTANIIYIKDLEGRHIFVNSAFKSALKMGRNEVYGKTVFELFPEDMARVFHENDMTALASDRPLEFEEDVRLNGTEIVVLSVKFALKDTQGKKYAVCGVSTDISQLKKTEETLRRSERMLSEAQRIARLGNWHWDIVKNELRWSDEIYRIFGVGPRDFRATYEAFLGYVHPEDRGFVERSVDEAVYRKKSYSIDHRIVLPNGVEKMVHEQGEVLFDPEGNPLSMTGTVQDITERKRAEEELRKLTVELEKRVEERTSELKKTADELASANREIETFTYSVAHDLRSPLRLIDGFSQLLLRKQKDRLDPGGRDQLERIRAAVSRMGQLIDDLLNLYHVVRAELNLEEVDLSAMARSIIIDLEKAAPERVVRATVEDSLLAYGDERLLRMVLENLIGNAWKYSSKRKIAEIAFGSEKKGAVFFVHDNGVGFSMESAEEIFEPFHRLHSADEFPGTGVGLATVRRIIQRHNGRVWAESRPNEGSTFYFTLGGA
ncbi:MAG: PAS domain S-box protein [Deltaproteobacteria bacterium]|nr:PAS domain S-box protein [Deltaproteobacteria bacterium]